MNTPKISVVTVVFNNVGHIRQCINNTLSQSYKNLELIVIDGASTDGTLDIIKKYGDRIRFISEPDKGIYDAMMKGVRIATGEWVIFRNVGDYWANPHVIEDVFAEYCDHGEDIIAGRLRIFKTGYYHDTSPAYPSQHYFYGMPFLHPSTFIRRTTQLKYPFPLKYKQSADYWFFANVLADGGTFCLTPHIVALFDGISGISTDRYDVSIYENIDILKNLGAPQNHLQYLEKRAERTEYVIKKRKDKLYDLLYRINYWYKVYYKEKWKRYNDIHELFSN